MRELTSREIDQVSGGGGVLGGVLGAGVGGLTSAGHYALQSSTRGGFSWSRFGGQFVHGAVSGALIGSGATLAALGWSGAWRGASVLGVTLMGAGGAMGVTRGITPAP